MVERFFATVARLPGPPELAFAIAGVLIALVAHAMVWATGSEPTGTLVPDLWVAPILAGGLLALSAFMKRNAESAFRDFRAALDDPEHEDEQRQRLTVIRDRVALLGGLGLVLITFAVYLILVKPTTAPRPQAVENLVGALWLPASFVLGMVIAQTLAQLRAVRHLSSVARRIDILNPGSVDALSRVTLVGSVGLLTFVFAASLALPQATPSYLWLDGVLIVFAVLAFVLPLTVMHRRLGDQKAELLAGSSLRVRTVLEQLHAAIDVHDLSAADGLNKMVSSALAERDLLTRLSTWPWTTATIRGFGSALLVPVVIFVITRGIDKLFT
jgi:hypothetical protein